MRQDKRSARYARAWAICLFFGLWALSAPLFAAPKVALLVTDSDIFIARRAVDGTDFPGLEVRAFCLRDLEEIPADAAFVAESSLALVDIMEDKLSAYARETGLLAGRPVYGLRGSKDDARLINEGFIFDEAVSHYFDNLSVFNVREMVRRAAAEKLIPGLEYAAAEEVLQLGLYHPEAPRLFESAGEYLAWNAARPGALPDRPVLGLMFFETYLLEGQREALDELIYLLEEEGFDVLPVFGSDLPVIETLLLDENGRSRADAILSFSLKFYMSYSERVREGVLALDAPIFNAIKLYTQTTGEWAASGQGISSLDIIWNIDNPETSGVIEPTVVMGKVEEILPGGGRVYSYELVPGAVAFLAKRIKNWLRLRDLSNSEKKVALIYYNNSRGKQNVGASYLNVFRSIAHIVASLQADGYSIPAAPELTEDEVKGLILRGGRNIGAWAPGELDDLIMTGNATLWPISEYLRYFAELPQEFQDKVTAQWGAPADGIIMVKDQNIVIPAIRRGNLVILPQPARGDIDDPMKLYHDPVLYPHHQYIAVYLWLKNVFGMDAMIHLGTHGTLEWLPGKEAGLALADPPEVLLGDTPDIYPYIVDNVGEGLQAKRRGRAVVIDHLTPPLVEAGSYREYDTLKTLIDSYQNARRLDSPTQESYARDLNALALELGLDGDLRAPSFDDPEAIGALSVYLEYLGTQDIPYGLHSFGLDPAPEFLSSLRDAIVKGNPEADPETIAANLSASAPREMASLLKALRGGYIEPAEGNDPVRNPDALPTGRNFYGISPNRLPTPAAWELGRKAAEEIIANYVREKGTYPSKVAVVLWAVEALRNEGLNEATILYLIGVEPLWNPSGQVVGTRPIPGRLLGRPRIDVTIDASGLYRDLFPDKILFLDRAIRQAAVQDDVENFIAAGDIRNRDALIAKGFTAEEAGRFSRARIFSETVGAYGNRVSELASASGLWESDESLAAAFREHTGYAYGEETWGEPARDSLEANLKDSQVAWHSVSSKTYGVLDNDDMFMFLGGLSLAIKSLSGEAPQTFIADHRDKGEVAVARLDQFIAQETRSRYLNPNWIEGMRQEGYAGAHEMSNFVEYLWGWQATAPEAVGERAWDDVYSVYVADEYGMGIPEFMDQENAWAYQSITGRLLETVRKGYWEASPEIQRELSVDYATSVINRGVACCDHTCNNPQLNQMVLNIISMPGAMSPEMVAQFKIAVEKAGQKTLEDMVAERENLLRDLGQERQAADLNPSKERRGPEDPASAEASVRGLKMEPVEAPAEETSISSSGVEWTLSAFVLALLAIFYFGYRLRRSPSPRRGAGPPPAPPGGPREGEK
ncbi:MAG: cobaltochelatase subunit CobN [Deltaproteobacteria bacterium]|jgi:cobaltochelatase CobN|nr:cobaltochelatase subunit CobN [Deltaproteobacteria bacterium]